MSAKLPDYAKDLLQSWLSQIIANEKTHKLRALWFRRMYYILGIPASILSGFTTAGLLADMVSCIGSALFLWCLTKAIISALVTTLVSVQTYMQLWPRFQDHKLASDRYQVLLKNIQKILVSPPNEDPATILGNIQFIFDDIVTTSPIINSNEQYLRYAVKNDQGIKCGGYSKKRADIEAGTERTIKNDEVVIGQKFADKMERSYTNPMMSYQLELAMENGIV